MASEAPEPATRLARGLVAIDIGNSRIKLGLFTTIPGAGLPTPDRSLSLERWDGGRVQQWLTAADSPASPAQVDWRVCSVNRPAEASALQWLASREEQVERLAAEGLPLAIEVERPDLVGMDRLASAIGANRLRRPTSAAIVIDVGSAITVDLIKPNGAFAGGAILPGIVMSARALHDYTDLLPLVPMSELGVPPPALGVSTIPAMRSGLFWGAVGAMRELVSRLGAGLPAPQVFLTGGAAPAVASLLSNEAGEPAAYVPHLTLGGVALASPLP